MKTNPILFTFLGLTIPVCAATLTWDIAPGTVGAGNGSVTGGTGAWNLANGNWTTDGGVNNRAWVNNVTPDSAIFDGTAGTVTLGTGITANSLTFNTTGYSITGNTLTLQGTTPTITTGSSISATISSLVSGSAGLIKTGAGTLILGGANTYTGVTTISGGTLSFNTLRNVGGGNSALGAPTTVENGTIDLGAGGTITYTGAATSSDRIIHVTGGAVGVSNSGTGLLTLTGGITGTGVQVLFRGTGNITESGVISFDGTVGHTDGGVLTLTNPNNSFAGSLSVASGTINANSVADSGVNSAIGAGNTLSLGQGNVAPNGVFQFSGTTAVGSSNRAITLVRGSGTTATTWTLENTQAGQLLTLSGDVTITNPAGGTGTMTLALAGAGNGLYSGTILGAPALAITKSGAGIWTLSGANTYTGATTLAGGTLTLSGGNNRLPTGTTVNFTGTSTLNVGATAQSVLGLSFTGSLTGTIAGSGGSLAVTGATAINVGYNSGVTATLIVDGANVTFAPALYVGRSESGAAASGTGTLWLKSGSFTTTSLYLARTIYTSGAYAPVASGTLTLAGGTATIKTIFMATSNKNNSPTTSTVNLNNGAVLITQRLQTSTAGAETITFNWNNGTIRNFDTATDLTIDANFNGGFKLLGTGLHAFDIASARLGTVNQAMSGTGNLTKIGSGTLRLAAAANTYSGATFINEGILDLTGTLTGGTALSVNNAAIFTQSTAGAISGAASLTHNSSATSTLSGVNTFSGPTVVNNGKLLVHGSLSSTGLVTVKAGATFGGIGSAGHVTVEDLAFLSPGKPEFTENQLTLNSLALVANSILLFDLADPIPEGVYTLPFYSDHIALQGNLTLAGKLRVNPLPGFDAAPDNRWMLMSYAVGSGVFTDNHLAVDVANSPGLPLPPEGFRYVIDTSEPGFVFLSVAVPEPATGALLAFGLLLLGRAIRRRR